MGRLIVSERQNIVAIADAIRNKTGDEKELTFGEMIGAIDSISSGGIDTSDASATADDIANGKTAYINGTKVTGTFTLDEEIASQDNIISQIQTAIVGKTSNNLDTSDATASAEDIVEGKTAYVNGKKVTGAHTCSSGGVSVPELITISWECIKDSWSSSAGIATIDCAYIGINEDGVITRMIVSGNTGSVQCIPSMIEISTAEINGGAASITKVSSNNHSHIDNTVFVSSNGSDRSMIALSVGTSQHLTITCLYDEGYQ